MLDKPNQFRCSDSCLAAGQHDTLQAAGDCRSNRKDMMRTKCPYNFPCRSRKAMIEYLASHESYSGWNHPFRSYSPLSWNVKFHHTNNDGKRGDEKVSPELDDQWAAHVESNSDLWNWIVEDMQRQYTDGEYTTYPGSDQGDWTFCFAGSKTFREALISLLSRQAEFNHARRYIVSGDATFCLYYANGWQYDIVRKDNANCPSVCLLACQTYMEALGAMTNHAKQYAEQFIVA